MKSRPPSRDGTTPIASNRRARHDYAVLDTVEAGIVPWLWRVHVALLSDAGVWPSFL